jgi:hypothetical protein
MMKNIDVDASSFSERRIDDNAGDDEDVIFFGFKTQPAR